MERKFDTNCTDVHRMWAFYLVPICLSSCFHRTILKLMSASEHKNGRESALGYKRLCIYSETQVLDRIHY